MTDVARRGSRRIGAAVRRRAAGAAGRRQQPGSRIPRAWAARRASSRAGEGAWLEDADGNRYVDLVLSWGPLDPGPRPPGGAGRGGGGGGARHDLRRADRARGAPGRAGGGRVPIDRDGAVREQRHRGGHERRAAGARGHRPPGDRQVRRLLSRPRRRAACLGRLGRGHAGPARFAGGDAGHGGRHARRAVQRSGARSRRCSRRAGRDIAAVLVEPVAGNMGVVPPAPGFLEGLRALTRRAGALLVFDEVMTGWRVHPVGAQVLYGIAPDLTILGKVVGGGLPAAAYGGAARADGADRARRAGVPGRDPLRQPASRWPPGWRRSTCSPARASGSGPSAGRRAPPNAITRPRRAAGVPVTRAAGGDDADAVLHRRTGDELRRRQARRPLGVRRLLPRHARRGRLPPAVGVRGGVHLRRARRGGARRVRGGRWPPHGRGSGRRRRDRRADRRLPAQAARRPGGGLRGRQPGGRLDPDRAPRRLHRRARAERARGAGAAASRAHRRAGARAAASCPPPRPRRTATSSGRESSFRCRSPLRTADHAAALQRRQAGRLRRAAGRGGRLAGRGERRHVRPPALQPGSPRLRRQPVRRRDLRRRPRAALGPPRAARSCTGSSGPTDRS